MITVAEVFQDSYSHVLSNIIGESKNKIIAFIFTIILQNKPYLLVNEEGIQHAIDIVFTDKEHTDFILTLTYVFFSRLGGDEKYVHEIVGNMARGLSVASPLQYKTKAMTLLPDEYSSRLGTYIVVEELLSCNKWLIVLLMLQLFISVDIKQIDQDTK